jgi:putative alpha-1,2-mannosidase
LKANSDQEEGKNASKVEDEEDSEWDDRMPSRQHQIDNDNAEIERFVHALPTCLLLTVGFHAKPGESKDCYCPCSNEMKR